jgi:dienelactone hydrolase
MFSRPPSVRTRLAVIAAAAALAALTGPGAAHAATSAGTRDVLATVREAAAGLPGHTVYRPADLRALPKDGVPVIAYGNGACAASNLSAITFLTGLASQGYLVIARGAPDAFPVPSSPGTTTARPDELVAAIDWATTSPEAKRQLDGRVDPTRIGVLGHSCGGIEALVAGTDARVGAVAGFNTGYLPEPAFGGYGRDRLAQLHTPTLLVHGGPDDVAYQNSIDNYALLTVPAVLAGHATVGHSALISGEEATTGWQIAADWFDYVLRGDGRAGARFVGPDCGLCGEPEWAVESKGLSL